MPRPKKLVKVKRGKYELKDVEIRYEEPKS